MLKANGKYEDSNQQMSKFATMRPADHRAIAFLENPNYLPKILEKGKNLMFKNYQLIQNIQILEVLSLTVSFILLAQEEGGKNTDGMKNHSLISIPQTKTMTVLTPLLLQSNH